MTHTKLAQNGLAQIGLAKVGLSRDDWHDCSRVRRQNSDPMPQSAGAVKCARLEFSGCCVKSRRPRSRRGFTRQSESPNAHISGSRRFKNTTKISREDPHEREERMKMGAGEGKKRATILGGPAEGGPRRGGVRGTPTKILNNNQPQQPHNTTQHTHTQHKLAQNGFAKNGLAKNVIEMAKTLNTNFSVLRAPACVWCCRLMGWSIFRFCRTQLAHLSLAELLARLETSRECLVHGTP